VMTQTVHYFHAYLAVVPSVGDVVNFAVPTVGPSRYCSPPHRMPYNSLNEISNS
jgi:hypothetical protein